MIELSEEWKLRNDKYQWILENHYLGFNRKTKEVVAAKNETYHHNLNQVANKLFNEEAKKEAETVEGIYEKMEELSIKLTNQLIEAGVSR